MSTSAIAPISSIDFGSSSATASQQSVFDSLLSQLQQSIGTGNLTTSQTLLNAIDALSPSSVKSPLGTFLTSLTTALKDGSVTEAQSALATYQSNNLTAIPATSTANTSATATAIAANLVQSRLQLSLVTTLLGPNSSFGSNAGNTSSTSLDSSATSLIGILNAAYGTGSNSSSTNSSSTASSAFSSTTSNPTTPSATPYDTLVSSIQASLAGGHGALTPALAYLQATGNFVNTSA
jgi:hypothetical protein